MRFRVPTVAVLFLFAFTGVAVAQPDPVAAPEESDRASVAPHAVVASATAPAASTGSAEKPTPPLTAVETGRWTVELEAQANVSRAAAIDNRDARIATVRRTLVRTANRSQAAVVAALEAAGAPFESFWLRNSVVFSGDDALAEQIRGVPGVTAVRPERIYPLVQPVETAAAVAAAAGDPEWGVDKIGADEAWAFGVTGGGIVVGNVDTGVEFTHPALVNQYRGNNGDGSFTHDYNWWDPTGICGDEPCDNVGHGSHTMGTMVGGDGPGPFAPDIGVAPERAVDRRQGLRGPRLLGERAALRRRVHRRADRSRRGKPTPGPGTPHRQQLLGRRAG